MFVVKLFIIIFLGNLHLTLTQILTNLSALLPPSVYKRQNTRHHLVTNKDSCILFIDLPCLYSWTVSFFFFDFFPNTLSRRYIHLYIASGMQDT